MRSPLGALCAAALLAACAAGSGMSGKKADNYQGTVTRVAVAVRDLGRQGSEGPNTRSRNSADGAMIRATGELRQSLPVRVPAAFNAAGVPATLVQTPEDRTPRTRPAGITHALVVLIGGGSSTCNFSSCIASVEIEARLLDARTGATAWTGQMTVSDGSSSSGAMSAAVGEQLVEALRRDGLIR